METVLELAMSVWKTMKCAGCRMWDMRDKNETFSSTKYILQTIIKKFEHLIISLVQEWNSCVFAYCWNVKEIRFKGTGYWT